MVNAYRQIGIFAFGAAAQQLTTDIAKYTIGRLRPHFFSVSLNFFFVASFFVDRFLYIFIIIIRCARPLFYSFFGFSTFIVLRVHASSLCMCACPLIVITNYRVVSSHIWGVILLVR